MAGCYRFARHFTRPPARAAERFRALCLSEGEGWGEGGPRCGAVDRPSGVPFTPPPGGPLAPRSEILHIPDETDSVRRPKEEGDESERGRDVRGEQAPGGRGGGGARARLSRGA